MVTVKITETYDLKTTVNRMGIIGIHTPTGEQIRRLYPGLVKNHKFIRFLSCDVVGACASVLPADPLSVGVQSGDVAPEDMFNPILMKACTNESFDTLCARIIDQSDVGYLGSVNAGDYPTGSAPIDTAWSYYYGLLAEHGRFKKAMPQSGFSMKGLRPICHQLISTYGNLARPENDMVDMEGINAYPTPNLSAVDTPNASLGNKTPLAEINLATTFRGKPVPYPRFPLHFGVEDYDVIPNVALPKTMVACIIVPPARLHEFYYRMRVTWTVSFEEVCTAIEAGSPTAVSTQWTYGYAKNYTYSSSKAEMENSTDFVDTTDVSLNKIMES